MADKEKFGSVKDKALNEGQTKGNTKPVGQSPQALPPPKPPAPPTSKGK